MLGSIVYATLVLLGTAALGFAVAPAVAHALGLFPIDTEARAFFSLITLRSVPYLLGLSVGSGFAYDRLRALAAPLRAAVYLANVIVAYAIGAAIGALALTG